MRPTPEAKASKRSAKVLQALVLSTLVLLGLAWFLLRRAPGPARETPATPPAEAIAPEHPPEPTRAVDQDLAARRLDVLPEARPPEPPPAPAIVTGNLVIDDDAQPEGTVVFRADHGRWKRSVEIGSGGFFRVDDVPITKLTVAFELPPRDGRPILVPEVDLEPRPGAVEDLQLSWRCTQVNVRVLGSEPNLRTSVSVEGPGIHGAVEIDEKGKGALSVVGRGLFTFTATRAGKPAHAELELEGGEGLETVLLSWNE